MRQKIFFLNLSLVVAASGLLAFQTPYSNPNFTGGKVTPIDDKSGTIAHFRFDPGSRTKWHSHSQGQIILVEEGIGHTQVRGGPLIELKAGQTIWCPPNVEHWHGAGPNAGGVQYNVTRGDIKWLEEVSDNDYNAKPKHITIP